VSGQQNSKPRDTQLPWLASFCPVDFWAEVQPYSGWLHGSDITMVLELLSLFCFYLSKVVT
jgi:hypothetical protein